MSQKKPDHFFAELAQPAKAISGGCELEDVPMYIKQLQEKSEKPYCVVSNWCIFNLTVDDHLMQSINSLGLKPKLIYATNVIDDQRKRWSTGSQVRTTLLLKFHDRCIFETQGTFYILVGDGAERLISPEAAASVIFE